VRTVKGIPVEEGSERAKEFERNKKIMVDSVSRIIRTRRGEEGSGNLEELPFIDALLQNYSSEEKVRALCRTCANMVAVIGSNTLFSPPHCSARGLEHEVLYSCDIN
jgi:hypothetical protein